MQSKTLTNRSHLALFRYAVSHPYLFSAVSHTHTHTEKKFTRHISSAWKSESAFLSFSLCLQLLYQQSRTLSLPKKLAKWSGTKEQYMRIEGIVQWHRLAASPHVNGFHGTHEMFTNKQTNLSTLFTIFHITPQSSSFLLRTRNRNALYSMHIQYFKIFKLTIYYYRPFHISWTS